MQEIENALELEFLIKNNVIKIFFGNSLIGEKTIKHPRHGINAIKKMQKMNLDEIRTYLKGEKKL